MKRGLFCPSLVFLGECSHKVISDYNAVQLYSQPRLSEGPYEPDSIFAKRKGSVLHCLPAFRAKCVPKRRGDSR
jgi:hypothetical protein